MFGKGSKGARRARRTNDILALLALLAYTAFALFPLFWIFLLSLKTQRDVIATPPKFIFSPTLQNYAKVLSRPDFLTPFKNSVIVTFGALFLSVLIALPAAYALARMDFRFKEDLAFAFLSLRFAPELWIQTGESGEAIWQLLTTCSPPFKHLAESLDPDVRAELHAAWVNYYEGHKRGGEIRAPNEYMLILGTRRAA